MKKKQARDRVVVAIDGPAGVGKSSAARRLAESLGYTLVDTGALYRAVALAARERNVSWDDGEAVGALARRLMIELGRRDDGTTRVMIGEQDRSDDIRSPEISMGASAVSRHAPVREALLGQQRRLGSAGGVVLEGRDIGTVVFPDAEVKVFLTARAEVRAQRRCDELRGKGEDVDYEATLAEVRLRDEQDSTRDVAPLRPADGAIVLDSSDLDLEAVVESLLDVVSRAKKSESQEHVLDESL